MGCGDLGQSNNRADVSRPLFSSRGFDQRAGSWPPASWPRSLGSPLEALLKVRNRCGCRGLRPTTPKTPRLGLGKGLTVCICTSGGGSLPVAASSGNSEGEEGATEAREPTHRWVREVEGPTAVGHSVCAWGGVIPSSGPLGGVLSLKLPTPVSWVLDQAGFSPLNCFLSPQTFLGSQRLGQHKAQQAGMRHAEAVRLQSTGWRAHLVVGIQAASGDRALEVLLEEEGG